MISKFTGYIALSLSAFFLPITWALTSIVAVVIIDTITGVMVAGKEDIKNIKSKKLSSVISKLIFYFSGIILGRIAELYIDDSVPFIKLVLVAVMIIEIKSVDENFKSLFGFSFIDKMLEGMKLLKRKQ